MLTEMKGGEQMFIDELRHRIDILAFEELRDEFGGVEGKWRVIVQRWAKVEENGGGESYDNQQVKAVGNVKITMRYLEGLNEKNRISYKGKIYEICNVSNVLSGNYTTIADCKEMKDGV